MTQYKIAFTEGQRPDYMWAVGYYWPCGAKKRVTFEITHYTQNFKESYIRLFNTESEAQDWINKMNQEFNLLDDGEKVYWFKNRNNAPIRINTTLKKYKSRYVPLAYAMNKSFGLEYVS